MIRRLLLAFLLAFSILPPATAAARHMQVRLLAETLTPRPGSEVRLALSMSPEPGWHGYWSNTGDAGAPDRVAWRLPPGVTVSRLAYPVPERLLVGRLMNYVYAHPYALLGEIRIPAGLTPGTSLPIAVRIDYLVCSDTLCVPESADVSLALTIGDGSVTPAMQRQFDAFSTALPRPLGSGARFTLDDGKVRIAIPLGRIGEVRAAYFYPAQDGAIDYAAPQSIGTNSDLLIIETAAAGDARPLSQLSGVIALERPDGRIGLSVDAVPGPVPRPERMISGAETGIATTLFLSLIGAIAGGFILNAMPCVFPVLSLKALSLARSGESAAAARLESIAYAGGTMVSCLALGGIILLLRAGGEAVGWAFQFQSPHVTLILFLLVTAIGLNLAGLFELPGLSFNQSNPAKKGTASAFWTGVLAAFVATPCTGPFMAAALGSALVLPAAAALLVFAGLGIGLALPFLLIGFIPALRNRLPRPGPWMNRLRHLLAVPMLLTALWLGWVLARQAGLPALWFAAGSLLLIAPLLWWIGRRQSQGRSPALAALFAIVIAAMPVAAITFLPKGHEQAKLPANSFSEAQLATLRAGNRPVFVYFTADWCLTCKVNEQAAINREAVQSAFAKAGVAVLVGDWTNGDPAISRFLESQGRSGVPLYLFYRPGSEAPEVLPQILNIDMLTALAHR